MMSPLTNTCTLCRHEFVTYQDFRICYNCANKIRIKRVQRVRQARAVREKR